MKENTAQRVLKALMTDPRGSDRKLGRQIGISQPTVTRTRHQLQDQGFVSFFAIPNLKRLGFPVLALSVAHDTVEEDDLREHNSVVFAAKQPSGFFVISAHSDITAYAEFADKIPLTDTIIVHTSYLDVEPVKPLNFSELPISKLLER